MSNQRATLRELKQDEATARGEVRKLRRKLRAIYEPSGRLVLALYIAEAQAMLRNIQRAIKRREKEKRA